MLESTHGHIFPFHPANTHPKRRHDFVFMISMCDLMKISILNWRNFKSYRLYKTKFDVQPWEFPWFNTSSLVNLNIVVSIFHFLLKRSMSWYYFSYHVANWGRIVLALSHLCGPLRFEAQWLLIVKHPFENKWALMMVMLLCFHPKEYCLLETEIVFIILILPLWESVEECTWTVYSKQNFRKILSSYLDCITEKEIGLFCLFVSLFLTLGFLCY